jgi:hypothetical protein
MFILGRVHSNLSFSVIVSNQKMLLFNMKVIDGDQNQSNWFSGLLFLYLTMIYPRVEAGKNTLTVIPVSRRRR